jgi:hypothetical protein
MIGVAFHVHDLLGHIFSAVPDRVDDHAAAHRTVRTRRARLIGPRHLQNSQLCICWFEIEAKQRRRAATQRGNFEEITA